MDAKSLNKIKKFFYKYNRLPTYNEMTKLLGVTSTNAVSYIVKKWVKAGLMTLDDKKLAPTDKFFAIPILGAIKAGPPTMEQYYEPEMITFNNFQFKNPGYTYMLRVSGDSMINAGIQDGDWVVIDKLKEPKTGDIVVANIDWEWTLKYFHKKGDFVYLSAANPKYPDYYPRESLSIGGVVIKVIREYYS